MNSSHQGEVVEHEELPEVVPDHQMEIAVAP
jgi:hypothetical protein